MNDLISVIVPAYNAENYIEKCLDSILAQTYQNIEIIIIASTSNDASVEICEEYAKKDKRIKLIHSKPNGLSAARNRGIDIATGEYLSFIDSDDYVDFHFLENINCLDDYENLSNEQLKHILMKKNIEIQRLKKAYTVKEGGMEKRCPFFLSYCYG